MRYLPLRVTLQKQKSERTGEYELVVRVENPMDYLITRLNLSWCFNYDNSFDDPKGKSFSSSEFIQAGNGPLMPGDIREFIYPADQLRAMRSVIDSLSPERYCLRIEFDGTTETAIEGPAFGAWVQQQFG